MTKWHPSSRVLNSSLGAFEKANSKNIRREFGEIARRAFYGQSTAQFLMYQTHTPVERLVAHLQRAGCSMATSRLYVTIRICSRHFDEGAGNLKLLQPNLHQYSGRSHPASRLKSLKCGPAAYSANRKTQNWSIATRYRTSTIMSVNSTESARYRSVASPSATDSIVPKKLLKR